MKGRTKKLDSWTFTGVAKDALIWVKLLDKIGGSTLGVIFASSKQYYSLYGALRGSVKMLVGSYHKSLKIMDRKGKETMTPVSPNVFAKMVTKYRPQYSKLIFESKSICSDKVISSTARATIKAG